MSCRTSAAPTWRRTRGGSFSNCKVLRVRAPTHSRTSRASAALPPAWKATSSPADPALIRPGFPHAEGHVLDARSYLGAARVTELAEHSIRRVETDHALEV